MADETDNEISNLFNTLENLRRGIESKLKELVEVIKDREIVILNDEEVTNFSVNYQREFEVIKKKIVRKEKKCIMFGETSSGKSTLINALLRRTDLPVSYGPATNCIVQLQKSTNGKTHYLIQECVLPKDEEAAIIESQLHVATVTANLDTVNTIRNMALLRDVILNTKIGNRVCIDVFYNNDDCPFLNDNMVFVDTPGINTDLNTDGEILRYCEDADLFLFIVNSTSWINRLMIDFIQGFVTKFFQPNIFLIFNHWDEPDNEDNREDTKRKFINDATKLFRERFGDSINLPTEKIFFLCSREQIWINTKNERLKNSFRWESRNEDFIAFRERLQREMNENSLRRRLNYLRQLHGHVEETLGRYKCLIDKIKEKISIDSPNFGDVLKSLETLKDPIRSKIESIFTEAYEDFLSKSLKIINEDIPDEGNELTNKTTRLVSIQNKIMSSNFLKVKAEIKDIVDKVDGEYSSECKKLIEEIYLPCYITEMEMKLHEDAVIILKEIKRTINIATGVLVGSSVALSIASLATGGIAFIVSNVIRQVAIRIGVAAAASCVVEGGVISFIDQPFKFIWENNQKNLKEDWISVKILFNLNIFLINLKICQNILRYFYIICKNDSIKYMYSNTSSMKLYFLKMSSEYQDNI